MNSFSPPLHLISHVQSQAVCGGTPITGGFSFYPDVLWPANENRCARQNPAVRVVRANLLDFYRLERKKVCVFNSS